MTYIRKRRKGRFTVIHGAHTAKKPLRIRRALTQFRENAIRDMGGIENISSMAMATLDHATNIKGIIESIHEYYQDHPIIENGELAPILRTAYLAYCNSFSRHMALLGLDVKEAPGKGLADIIRDLKSEKGEKNGKVG